MGEEGNNLGDVVRKQVEEIMRKYDVQAIGDIPLSALFPILFNSVARYEVREDIQQEDVDELARKLKEIGFPDTLAQEVSNKIYEIIPTREMKTKMDRAVELARTYLPTLADEVKNGVPYLITNQGMKILLSTRPSQINGDAFIVPVYLFFYWVTGDEEKTKTKTSDMPSSSHIIVEQPLGNYRISGPKKEEFRQSTLEMMLDYVASHPQYPRFYTPDKK